MMNTIETPIIPARRAIPGPLQQRKVLPFKVVGNVVCADTVEALEALLYEAERGDITGIAFVCTRPHSRYITDVVGSCYENPTFARGMVAFLADELAGLVHRRDINDSR